MQFAFFKLFNLQLFLPIVQFGYKQEEILENYL